MKRNYLCFWVFLGFYGFCSAQQVVTSGGYSEKSDVSVNWILGGNLSDFPSFTNIGTSDTFGNYQVAEKEISIKIYPLPAIDFINIEILPVDTNRFTIELFNSTGVKFLKKVVAFQPKLQLDIRGIPPGIYYLKIFQITSKEQFIGIEKIIKQ